MVRELFRRDEQRRGAFGVAGADGEGIGKMRRSKFEIRKKSARSSQLKY
jgi:hypothetical protein